MTSSARCPISGAKPTAEADQRRFDAFVDQPEFPCVGARSALHTGRLRHASHGTMGSVAAAQALRRDLRAFSEEFPDPANQPVSFVALFDDVFEDELAFERRLWEHLQVVHDLDRQEYAWDATVSDNPSDEQFSMSIGGRAYFVVGMHPKASRLARRSPTPCLVFNFHNQFEALKASGKYGTMQNAIRKRDLALQGSINPVLARFGESSEARQYSGREVPADWVCPFSGKKAHV